MRKFIKPSPLPPDRLAVFKAAKVRAMLELYAAALNGGVVLKDGRRVPVGVRGGGRPRR